MSNTNLIPESTSVIYLQRQNSPFFWHLGHRVFIEKDYSLKRKKNLDGCTFRQLFFNGWKNYSE